MRALVVDDSSTIRAILSLYLKKMEMDVIEAADALEALQRLKEAPFDFVLVDWNMPEMDGITFVRAVRAEGGYAKLPLMMVTTNSEMANVALALEAGANEYIMKPFTADMLREKLDLLGLRVETAAV